jgi:RNA-splicing ligase RtcB
MFELEGKFSKAKVFAEECEEGCIGQIQKMLSHPAFTNDVKVMPDTHQGMGSVIGFTMKMNPEKIIPNVIGVDIGCGMTSINVGKNIIAETNLKMLDEKIREVVPFGFNVHNHNSVIHMKNDFQWKKLSEAGRQFAMKLDRDYNIKLPIPDYSFEWFELMMKRLNMNMKLAIDSIGSLGGGNHFIEIGKSESAGDYWITIHSGSRNLGKQVCDHWQKKAKKAYRKTTNDSMRHEIYDAKQVIEPGWKLQAEIDIIQNKYKYSGDEDLAYLEGDNALGYLVDMLFAQIYANVNREYIAKLIVRSIPNIELYDYVESIHNYISFKDFIIRKGAIESYEGERMIIPFNMRDGILLVKGKSNPDWNYSAPHGAGRLMSRTKAKEKLDMDTFKEQMKGIFSTSVCQSTLDEAPGAYKDAKVIEDAIGPTCEIIDRIKPIMNMKDTSEGHAWQVRKLKKKQIQKEREDKYERLDMDSYDNNIH